MIQHRFSRNNNPEFSKILRNRVNEYFKSNKISRNANFEMKLKTLAALSLYIIPFFVVLFAGIQNLLVLYSLWILMGIGKCFIGTSVMHDAIHGSYSSKKIINTLLSYTANLIGADANIWRIQHNVLHHTFTNIENIDEDIEPRYFMRFSPFQPKKWFHKYQHIYAVILYCISTLVWVTAKDFFKLFNYRNKGALKSDSEFYQFLILMIIKKALYLATFIALPAYILPYSFGITFSMFITMHLVAGFLLTMAFQPAHLVDSSEFFVHEEPKINENWEVHQLKTTSNFATDNALFSWYVGGLNYQIEHHLFANICHVHYPKIAKIVESTAKEYDYPYITRTTLLGALKGHYSFLRKLGQAN